MGGRGLSFLWRCIIITFPLTVAESSRIQFKRHSQSSMQNSMLKWVVKLQCTYTNKGLQLSIIPDPLTKCINPRDHFCMAFCVLPVSLLQSCGSTGLWSALSRPVFSSRNLSIPSKFTKIYLSPICISNHFSLKLFGVAILLTESSAWGGNVDVPIHNIWYFFFFESSRVIEFLLCIVHSLIWVRKFSENMEPLRSALCDVPSPGGGGEACSWSRLWM